MPYHREGRRIKGLVRLNVNHILHPFNYSLYRTGIAVGDYPIDHHHYEYPTAPEIDFPPVPSFNILNKSTFDYIYYSTKKAYFSQQYDKSRKPYSRDWPDDDTTRH